MRVDAQWTFVSQAAPLSMVGGAGINIPSLVIDLLGQGVGTAPASIIGNATLFGTDLGLATGVLTPKLQCVTGTAFVTATGATLDLAIQLAPDLGTPTYQPGAWQTVQSTGALTAAQLTAGIVFARMDFPPVFPKILRPRYIRLLGIIPAGTDFTAGTIAFAGVVPTRDDQANAQASRNYSVS
jgi:hypothetical protein